jgi:hypothetical protein
MNNASLNQIVNKLLAFGHGHKYIKTVAHGQLDEMDLTSRITYPLMHIVPQDITPSGGRLQFSFDIVFADMPRMKSDKPENVLEIQSDMEQIARDLYTEIKNGGVLFGDMTEVGDDWSALPFQDEYHNYLSGVTLSINIIVASNWNACEIPADWVDGTGADIPQFGRDLTIAIYDEGVFRVNAREVNFIGSGVSVAADGNRANVTITGGGGGGGLTCEDLPSCETIIAIEESIDSLETEVAGKVDSVTGNIVGGTATNPTVNQVQADWNATSGLGQILNKPTIPDVPSTIVESVQAGDDIAVDATDPANPIVGVVPNTFLRLSGTEEGHPVTGPVQWDNINNYSESSFGGIHEYLSDSFSAVMRSKNTGPFVQKTALFSTSYESSADNPQARMSVSNTTTSRSMDLIMRANDDFIEVIGGVSYFQGLKYSADYRSNFELLSLIDLFTLKSRLWNAAANPTVDDDADEGFVSGRSLWLNTVTGVLWKCEDATAGAADWQVYYDPRKFTKLVSVVDSTAVTGTTANTALRWVTIPAGTFEAGDIMSVTSRIRKTGAAGTAVSRFYQNTSQSLTGANILGLYTLAPASILYQQFNRDLVIKSSTATEVVTTSSSLAIDETMATGAATQYNIDWSVTQHIGFYVQLTNGSDSVVQSYYSIEKITNIP